jgi:autotransporter-associated beta strand protein
VTLSGANTFSGTTNLNGGTLIVTGSLAGGITMSMGTTLAGTGTISGATQDYLNTIIAPGATAANGAIGTLTFGSDLALGGGGSGQINMDLTSNPSGTNDMINVGGNLSLYGGTVQVNPVNGVLGTGTYHLIHYTGTPLSGYASYLLLSGIPDNTRQSYGLSSATSHYIDLVVSGTPPASLVWAGGLNGNAWDVKTTTNWSGSDSLFWNADQVTFGNTGSNSPAVNIVGTVLPGSVVVDSTQNYTFSGSGKISGGTSLTKRGAGTLTLATSNDYTGQTKVEAGTLLITGSIGNNSPVLISGGTLMAGSNSALGTNNTVGTTINGSGTLDINAMNLQTEPITVQGAGVGGNGAIVNNSTSGVLFGYQSNALTQITLTGDTTFGGTGDGVNANSARWDIRGTGASLSTGGHAYNLTKTGNNVVSLVSVTVDSALADININQGTLRFENSSGFGDLSKTVTIASGATLQLLKTSNAMGKKVVSNGGTISASSDNPDPSNLDLVTGTVTVNSTTTVNAGTSTGILTLTNLISGAGGLTKTGPGTVIITGLPAYNGDTAVNVGILEINTVGSPVLHNVTGTATLSVGDGISATNLTVDSMNIGTLTLGIGSRVTIAPLPGGPTAGTNSLTSVPEPSTWAMLMLAAMGLGIYWRRSR